jgi:hypothetical protein
MRITPSLCRTGGAFTALTALTVAAPHAVASAPVPFRASFSGTASFVDGNPAFSGSGIATQLGAITTDGHVEITGVVDSPCANGVANINTEVLTAADGDTLTIVSDDVACPVDPGQPRYHGTGSWHVTGGTGRFAGASGNGSFDGHSDFAAGTFDITLTGALTQPTR